MASQDVVISYGESKEFPATLLLPPGRAGACVLLIHLLPADRAHLLAGRFVDAGLAVLLLDAAIPSGLADEHRVLPPEAMAAASAFAHERCGLPQLAVGHGLGGTLLLAAHDAVQRAAAITLINTPRGVEGFTHRATLAPDRYAVAARNITVGGELLARLGWSGLHERIERLGRPLLILHAPFDNTVDISNAAQIFTAAKHPKSFLSLDGADHVLARDASAQHAGDVIAAWAQRYLAGSRPLGTEVVVEWSAAGELRQRIDAGGHHLIADEPAAGGGGDAGPNPYDLLAAALGACTAMTLRLYADMKGLPLRHVSVSLKHDKVHAADCEQCETREGRVDKIERIITLEGDLDEAQRNKLLEIANKCPVHRTLHAEVWIPTRLAD